MTTPPSTARPFAAGVDGAPGGSEPRPAPSVAEKRSYPLVRLMAGMAMLAVLFAGGAYLYVHVAGGLFAPRSHQA